MAQRNEESVSPMTRGVHIQSPAENGSHERINSAVTRNSGLRTELDRDSISEPSRDFAYPVNTNGHAVVPAPEPSDYLNRGAPHDMSTQSPIILAAAPPSGTVTPNGRKSVQFARVESGGADNTGHTRQESWGNEDGDTPSRDRRGQSLMSKLKALTSSTGGLQTHSQSHSRSQSTPISSYDEGSRSAPMSPAVDRSNRLPHTLEEEGSDIDADAEETADEGGLTEGTKHKQKRRMRRPQIMHRSSQTAPNTPKPGALGSTDSPGENSRAGFLIGRRATDRLIDQRGHLSEGEGRDRLKNSQSAWRRGSSWITGARAPGNIGRDNQAAEIEGTPISRRPSNFRRTMTGISGGQSDNDAQTPKRPFFGAERATTFGTQRWKMLKHGLKLLGQKKDEHRVDYLKSTELMAELRAGAPAALMLASMIQRDEHGHKRIPVLLEQVKVQVTDSRSSLDDADGAERHLIFRIELEYGNGLNRMKWVVHRTLRDLINLHLKYKIKGTSNKYIQMKSDAESRPKQPRFPMSAFPYLRGIRGLGEGSDEDVENLQIEETFGDATHSETERRPRKTRRPSLGGTLRRSSGMLSTDTVATPGAAGTAGTRQKRLYNEKQRRRLEQYLQEMIHWLIFRPDSNRICRFLELSALGVRLAAEGSYHGKEGPLIIQSSKGLDFRRLLIPGNVYDRHSPKWFLVRHSYMVCVDSPENMHIYDVYLVDPKFAIRKNRRKRIDRGKKEIAKNSRRSAKHPQHHSLKLTNSERTVKLLAKNERQLLQFEDSINLMLSATPWSQPNRFGSFAPVRTGVYAQWLVDGRDYMWNVSRAINMAKDVIYIHDWWLSPQLYMRRPAAISQKWRLDRLLQKKAREGVKVFIIVYRNVEAAVPIDSEFTKFAMLDLHPNIFVQRSPNQFKKNQFFFAHHEKICIVDHTVAFVGGIDLCFGRWDTPQHSVVDDKPTGFEDSDLPKDADHCQLWPGKDYSNPRVQDFYKLNEPYAEMYDRSKTPRMPWHDISMQVVGQPARDLTRHFVQRWNYVLRGRKPTRPTPFLLPPPDYNPTDLDALGLTGTCEVQILRSAADWSLGITETEHSIMTAYCKMIEESEHFVYMENQFFITSCETMNVKIINKIGDAIVERAIRARDNDENWRCVILIPLVPGFQNTVDEPEGTSIRLIMQCQFRSICRGDGSIFGRLKSAGIDPEDYVTFYSLRSWGKIGPKSVLVTEQLYIHAKVIIVDDRIALIGSANINERSMLGNRDSECAAVVRDTDMLWSTMDGEPYLVGRFAHTLRMRLMREHLGLDVDEIMEEERRAELDREEQKYQAEMDRIYSEGPELPPQPSAAAEKTQRLAHQARMRSFNHDVDWEEGENPNVQAYSFKKVTTDTRVIGNEDHALEVDGEGKDRWKAAEETGLVRGRDSMIINGREVLIADIAPEGKGSVAQPMKPHKRQLSVDCQHDNDSNSHGSDDMPPIPSLPRRTTEQLGLMQLSQLPALPLTDDTDIGGPPLTVDAFGNAAALSFNPLTADIKCVGIDKDCMRDPLNEIFFEDTWRTVAESNTKIFRRVFRCNPDSEVTNWHEYTDFVAYAERFSQAQGGSKSTERNEQEAPGKSGPPGTSKVPAVETLGEKIMSMKSGEKEKPLGTVAEWAQDAEEQHNARHDNLTTKDEKAETNSQLLGGDEKEALRADEGASASNEGSNETFPPLDTAHYSGSTATADQEKASSPAARKTTFSPIPPDKTTPNSHKNGANQGSVKRRRRGTTKGSRKVFSGSDDLLTPQEAGELLSMVQGHLVSFPYDWLIKEEQNSNWLYQVDQVAPLQIYD